MVTNYKGNFPPVDLNNEQMSLFNRDLKLGDSMFLI